MLGYADSEYVAFRENVSLYESGNGRDRGSRPETPTRGMSSLSVRSPVAKRETPTKERTPESSVADLRSVD